MSQAHVRMKRVRSESTGHIGFAEVAGGLFSC
jgi:hypothetical protein